MRLSNISIRNKVRSAFAIVLLATLGLGGFAVEQMALINGSAAEVRDNWLPATGWLGAMSKSTEQFRARQGQLILSTSPTDAARMEKLIGETLHDFDQNWSKYEPTVTTPAELAIAGPLKKAWVSYLDDSKLLPELAKKSRDEAAQLYLGKLSQEFGAVRKG